MNPILGEALLLHFSKARRSCSNRNLSMLRAFLSDQLSQS